MKYDEFIQRVQEYAELETSEEAVRATEAVLSTLGERLYRTAQSDLAAQLPPGIGEFFTARQSPENRRDQVQRFSLEEFYNRVSARTSGRYPQAVDLAQAVIKVLREAVSAGEITHTMQELPDEYAALFQEGA